LTELETPITRGYSMQLLLSVLLFAVFSANVGLGSYFNSSFLNDVGEMLVLSGAAVLFVFAILKKEADAKK
jgi:hypothetical protein